MKASFSFPKFATKLSSKILLIFIIAKLLFLFLYTTFPIISSPVFNVTIGLKFSNSPTNS